LIGKGSETLGFKEFEGLSDGRTPEALSLQISRSYAGLAMPVSAAS